MYDSDYKKIDVREDYLAEKDNLLEILLIDKTTNKNILWATDSYESRGKSFSSTKQIKTELVTGIYGKVIQPRAVKGKEEQLIRTRDKAEVFTPLSVVKKMNDSCDTKRVTKNNWQEYVSLLKLEITCGEAPYIVSRYDPVSDRQELIRLEKRVGFLDRKIRAVSKYCDEHKDWVHWVKIALQSSYGYEWQGDNLLIARQNLLYTFIDFYRDKFMKKPSLKLQKEIAEIIVWNIFQMDGLKYVIPMSCKNEKKIVPGVQTLSDSLFGKNDDYVEETACKGCFKKTAKGHNGKYVKIMDWKKNKIIKFFDIQNKNT
jgi:hypothetical protein